MPLLVAAGICFAKQDKVSFYCKIILAKVPFSVNHFRQMKSINLSPIADAFDMIFVT
jgi:hypothetical protein